MGVEVNYLAILVAGIINMVVGYIWYGPLFGKEWMKLMGMDMEKMKAEGKDKGMGKRYGLMFVGSLLMAGVLQCFIVFAVGFMQKSGAMVGIKVAFWAWLGFILPLVLGSVLWEGKSWKLFILNAAYYLVSLGIIGAVLASWM